MIIIRIERLLFKKIVFISSSVLGFTSFIIDLGRNATNDFMFIFWHGDIFDSH